MARKPSAQLTFTFVDHSGELARTTINRAVIDDQAQPVPADITTLVGAFSTVSDMELVSQTASGTFKIANTEFAAAGQREDRITVVYEDNVTLAKYTFDIPGRKPALQPPEGRDAFNIAVAPWSGLKTAIEGAAKSPDGNPIQVLAFIYAGKRS